MKKIVMIFAAMAAVLSSCQKSELESVSENESKDIVLNISVSNPGADDTKALIKQGWVENDEISIWYDTNNGENPDLVIKYDGTKWIQKTDATVSGKSPSTGTGKYAKALYNGAVKVASKDDYTYENNTLTFDITNWVFLTEIQVVVYGDNIDKENPEKYTLSCDKFTPCTGCSIGADGITATTGNKGTAVTGIINDGVNSKSGVAFVFATADYSTSSTDKKDFAFTLKDNTSGSEVTKVYKPNVAIEAKANKAAIKALTIAIDSFKASAPDGFVDLGVVVNSKPVYWKMKNLGAEEPQDYGNLYSWGNLTGQSGKSISKGFSSGNYTGTAGAAINNTTVKWDITKNDAAYDTDNAWRMPTKEDFVELAKQCFLEWTENYNGTNVKGVIVWKAQSNDAGWFKDNNGQGRKIKDDGSSYGSAEAHSFSKTYKIVEDTHVFFPAAGYGSNTNLTTASSNGRYWSSTWEGSAKAYDLFFSNSNVNPQNSYNRYYGFSVRPVSD